MATSREKFDAAVNVIHSLPKNGPFQPSYEMMLTFYGLYKQATEGKCTKPKPWSWDIVAKKKWDAWSKLEDMAPEEAMDQYVEELKKSISSSTDKWNTMSQNDKRIVEAMPQEKPVRDFMDVIGSFYEIIEEKSPFAGNEDYEKRVVQRGNDFSQRDIVTEGVRDFTESLDGVRDYQESLEETSALSILDTEKDQWENRLKNSSNKVNGEIHVTGSSQDLPNGETVYDNLDNDVPEENGTSPDRVESESDDEFCDSFDQPSPDKVLNRIPPMHANSDQTKPIHRKKNQVHFAENSSLKSDVAIHSNVISESVEAERLFSSHNAHSDNDPRNHDETDSQSGQINPRVGYQSLLASGRTINSNSADVSDPRYLQAGPDAQILIMLQRIQQDISTVLTRLDRLEAVKKKKNPRWWPFPFQFPGKHMLFFVIWPVFLIWFFNGRRRKKSIR